MLPLLKSDRRPQKCLITSSTLPAFIDPSQPPQKPAPFGALWALKWCHTVDILLPAELRDIIKETEARQLELARITKQNDKYAKVIMKLGWVIEGDFFNEYIKKGDILMLSEGRPGIDTLFELRDGILHITVDAPIYERLGLVGRPIRDAGRRHKKNRFAIELNLRLPSMLSGKKGFERLKWACNNVLNHSVTWLFHDRQATNSASSILAPASIEKYHPHWHTLRPTTTELTDLLIPDITSTTLMQSFLSTSSPQPPHSRSSRAGTTYAAELLEYFSMLALNSPRLRVNDSIDPFLSRYSIPTHNFAAADGSPASSVTKGDIVRLRYHGFIAAAYVVRLFILLTKGLDAAGSDKAWGVVQAHGFGGAAVTVLRAASRTMESGGVGADEGRDGDVNTEMGTDVEAAVASEERDIAQDERGLEDVEMKGNPIGDETTGQMTTPKDKKEENKTKDHKARCGATFVCWENPAPL